MTVANRVLISLVVAFCLVLFSRPATKASDKISGIEMESSRALEPSSREMEHESNGPEGDAGIPMERFSYRVIVGLILVMATSGLLALWARSKPTKV